MSDRMLTVQLVRDKGVVPRYYLRLVGGNGEVLASSESYWSKSNARRAARKNFAGVPLRDLSSKPYRKFG